MKWCDVFAETMMKKELEKLKLVSIVERRGEFWYCKNTFFCLLRKV